MDQRKPGRLACWCATHRRHLHHAFTRARLLERNGETFTNLPLYFRSPWSKRGAEARLAMQKGQAVQKGAARALAPWQAQRAIEILVSATSAGCSVGTLADACGLSPSHFAHAFKASTGVPPHRWLLLHRVQRAREVTESTTDSLSAIALSCGFSDQSHLTRAFRSVMGSSPAAWRRERRMGVTAAELQSREAAARGIDRSTLASGSRHNAGLMGEKRCFS